MSILQRDLGQFNAPWKPAVSLYDSLASHHVRVVKTHNAGKNITTRAYSPKSGILFLYDTEAVPRAEVGQTGWATPSSIYIKSDRIIAALTKSKQRSEFEPVGSTRFFQERELPLSGDFVPSRSLLKLWSSALQSYVAEAEELEPGSCASISVPTEGNLLSKQFTKRLESAIVRMAHMLSYRRDVFRITIEHRSVSPTFTARLVNDFLVPPDRSSEFITKLFEELRIWLLSGRTFEGDWGELVVDAGGDLLFRLHRPKPFKTRGFQASDDE